MILWASAFIFGNPEPEDDFVQRNGVWTQYVTVYWSVKPQQSFLMSFIRRFRKQCLYYQTTKWHSGGLATWSERLKYLKHHVAVLLEVMEVQNSLLLAFALVTSLVFTTLLHQNCHLFLLLTLFIVHFSIIILTVSIVFTFFIICVRGNSILHKMCNRMFLIYWSWLGRREHFPKASGSGHKWKELKRVLFR